MNFFIVDDSDIKVEKIRTVIEEAVLPDTADIFVASTVNAAVTFLLEGISVDLMVLDLNLPVREGEDIKILSGLNIIKEINRRPVITRPHAIIGMTADTPIKAEAVRFFETEGWALIPYVLNSTDWEETITNRINYGRPRAALILHRRKIIILSSAPKDLRGINLGTEHRKIDDSIRMSTNRDKFEVILKSGGMFSTLVREFLSQKPEILHVTGHGDGEGIAMEDQNGNCEFIPLNALKTLLSTNNELTKCVVLNTCYSTEQAKALSEFNFYVIGMSQSTQDNFAESFAQGFYEAIGELMTIPDAFKIGIAYLEKSHPHQVNNPQLWLNGRLV